MSPFFDRTYGKNEHAFFMILKEYLHSSQSAYIYTHTMEYDLAKKKNKIFKKMDGTRDHPVKPDTEANIALFCLIYRI
jgi:hypothetical protein